MRFDKIESFNRYTLIYSADAAVHGTMTYMLDGVQTSEEFFLEAGENKTFRCLIDGTDKELLTARTEGGRLVRLEGDPSLIGTFQNITITGSNTWSLNGELSLEKD